MRVIAGEFRSRRLLSLVGDDTRPTPDRLRETLFSILGPGVEGCSFVDAYAGTGAVGIEALSRGAHQAVFIERNSRAVDVIRHNLESLKIGSRARIIHGSTHSFAGGAEADFVFLDPPYTDEREYAIFLEKMEQTPPKVLTVVQHSVRLALQENYGSLRRTRFLRQGSNSLSFFRVES